MRRTTVQSVGVSYRKYGDYDNMTQEQKNSVYNTIGLVPNISMPA